MSHFGMSTRDRFWSRCIFYAGVALVLQVIDASMPAPHGRLDLTARGVANAYHNFPGLPPGVMAMRAAK